MTLHSFSKSHILQQHLISKYFHLDPEHSSLYLIQSLRAFALSLVGIFLPIYIFILSENYLIFHNDKIINGLLWGLTYFMLRSVGTVLSSYLFTNFILQKVRMDRAIFISNIVEIMEITLWILAPQNLYLIILAGFLAGIKVTLFWIPYHIFFVRKFEGQKYGKIMGKRSGLQNLAGFIGPVLGGTVIGLWGYNILFMVSITVLLFSGFLITANVSDWQHKYHDLNKITKEYLFNKKYWKLNLAFLGESIDLSIFTIFWPVMLYLSLKNFVEIGILTSVAVFLMMITTIIAGKLLDRFGSKVVHGVGVIINSLLYIPRIFVGNTFSIYVIDIVDKLNGPFYSLPNMALSYEKAKRSENGSDFIIHRELTIHTCVVLCSGILILLLMNLTVWRWVFFVAAIGSSLTYFIDLDKN